MKSLFTLDGKVIVVTGAAGLLGKELSAFLKQLGAIVVPTDIHFESMPEHGFLLDITDEGSVKLIVSRIADRYGKIDGWINNAYPRTADWGNKLEDVSFDSWRKNVDMHLNGYFLCAKLALEEMKKRRSGSLINMSSIYGHMAPDFSIYEGTEMTMPVAYAAIKGGITNLTRYLAAYYGPYQIRVNTVSPGGVFAGQDEAFVKKYCKKVPLGRMATPKDIIAPVCFLMSDAADYMTGQNLVVDGGWSLS